MTSREAQLLNDFRAVRSSDKWNGDVAKMAETWARNPNHETANASALLVFEAARLFLAWRFGTIPLAEELYRVADALAVMPASEGHP